MAKQKRAESRARYFIRQQAQKRGWKIEHPTSGGDCLEEQEIMSYFPKIGLGQDKPDFLFCINGEPSIVVEAKNVALKIDEAISEAQQYAETINKNSKYKIKIAVGAAGEDDLGFIVVVRYLCGNTWKPLSSKGFEITNIPSKRESELALEANDASTNVQVPSVNEFIDAAIEISKLLRSAKVEAPLRPKVIGAMVLAMYEGDLDLSEGRELESINFLANKAIQESVDLEELKKKSLFESLKLSGSDFDRLSIFISRISAILRRLNIRAVLQTDTDFLGLFYEAFLRYGFDNNALGIVFTPRHITKFCVDLTNVTVTDRVIDIACGTGGFLVAAFDKMLETAHGPKAIDKVKRSLCGFDTNPTIWALSTLNMFFRGDGKSNMDNSNCFDKHNKFKIANSFTRAYLNPPFSQEDEPERDFIDASMDALEPEGLLGVVVKAGIFADDENKLWRSEFTRKHTLLGIISLPEDLFYPTSAPTSILLARAHIPQNANNVVFMARIWNDGYTKLKGKRVETSGSQLDEIKNLFENYKKGKAFDSQLATTVKAQQLLNGMEWSPQQWLPSVEMTKDIFVLEHERVIMSVYQTTAAMPDIANVVLDDFLEPYSDLPSFPLGKTVTVEDFFNVENGKSQGEKNYSEGDYPYISSGDLNNSIIRLINNDESELFQNGGITITAFGQAFVQPWPFFARGNGGSSVRVLIPKYKMNLNELIWFASQINYQRWRFFYARMAIKSRLERLTITSPKKHLPDKGDPISKRVRDFSANIRTISRIL